jgi:hypothetical protein
MPQELQVQGLTLIHPWEVSVARKAQELQVQGLTHIHP